MQPNPSIRVTQLKGSCYCGNIELVFSTSKSISELSTRKCTCSFCTKHAARYTSDPKGELKVVVRKPESLSYYRQGTETADFLICAKCGVFLLALSSIDEKLYGVININTLEDIEGFTQQDSLANYDGESVSQRLKRRKTSWISKVNISDTQDD